MRSANEWHCTTTRMRRHILLKSNQDGKKIVELGPINTINQGDRPSHGLTTPASLNGLGWTAGNDATGVITCALASLTVGDVRASRINGDVVLHGLHAWHTDGNAFRLLTLRCAFCRPA